MNSKATLLLLSSLTAACLTPHSRIPAQGGPPFALEAGEIKIQDLIDRSAAYLGRNILANEQELANTGTGAVTFKIQRRIETDRDGCEDLLTTLLFSKGFVVTTLDEPKGLYEVIAANGPRGREILNRAPHKAPEQVLARSSLRLPVTTVVKLKHINATIATNALRPFYASTGSPQGGGSLTLGNVGNNTAILLSGMQDQVAGAIRMLEICDVPPAAGEAAPDLAERIEALTRRVKALEEKLEARGR